jgi:hypothetical protein
MPHSVPLVRRVVVAGLAAVVFGLTLVAPAAAAVPRDRIVASGVVDVRKGESVSDVVIADGPVSIQGRVTGDVVAGHGRVLIGGRVHGDVVALSANAVHLGPRGRIGGDLVYRGAKPVVRPGAVGGEVRKLDVGKVADPFGFLAAAALWLAASISTLVFGLLLLWFAPRAADAAFDVAATGTGPAIGWGIGLLIGLPVVAVIALVTLVGIPLGIGLLLLLFPVYALGYTTSAWLLGRRLVGPPRGRVLSFLAGWAILRLLAIVPVLGGLIWLAATVFGLGVLVVAAWRARKPRAAAAPETA